MISSKDYFASQSLNRSLYSFFLLGILLRNSVVAALEVVPWCKAFPKFFCRFDFTLRIAKSILIFYHQYTI